MNGWKWPMKIQVAVVGGAQVVFLIKNSTSVRPTTILGALPLSGNPALKNAAWKLTWIISETTRRRSWTDLRSMSCSNYDHILLLNMFPARYRGSKHDFSSLRHFFCKNVENYGTTYHFTLTWFVRVFTVKNFKSSKIVVSGGTL